MRGRSRGRRDCARYGSAQVGPEFGQIPATMSGVRLFPGECCFQVIYFVANIFSSRLRRTGLAAARGNHPVNARG
jgi:hypothetical protein